jgi:hypothetical protein
VGRINLKTDPVDALGYEKNAEMKFQRSVSIHVLMKISETLIQSFNFDEVMTQSAPN